MKKKKMPILPCVAMIMVCILMLLFVLMPIPASGLTIRFYFGDFEGSRVIVYYTTDEDPGIFAEQFLSAEVDAETKTAVIKLAPELADHILQIRVDFPETDQVLSIKNVSVSSAGAIQHNYSPCDFFAEDNIAFQNDIPLISLVEPKQTAFIRTNEPDPYILFTSDFVRDMLQYRSSFRLTRLAVCMLVVLGYVIYRARLFDVKQ